MISETDIVQNNLAYFVRENKCSAMPALAAKADISRAA